MTKKQKLPENISTPDEKTIVINIPAHNVKTHTREYPETTKLTARAMRSAGMTYPDIANTLSIGLGTAHEWCKQITDNDAQSICNDLDVGEVGLDELSERIKTQLKGKCYSNANHFLSKISDEDVKKASLLQKTTAACQMIDKGRLLDNESTSNVLVYHKKSTAFRNEIIDIDSELMELEKDIDD